MRQKTQNDRSVMIAADLAEVVRKRSGSGFGEVEVMTDQTRNGGHLNSNVRT